MSGRRPVRTGSLRQAVGITWSVVQPSNAKPPISRESTALRLTFLGALVISLFVLLVGRLWFLQVMAGSRFVARAEDQSIRTIQVEAARGDIVDRDGVALVDNRFAQVVSVRPDQMGDEETRANTIRQLSEILAMSARRHRGADRRPARWALRQPADRHRRPDRRHPLHPPERCDRAFPGRHRRADPAAGVPQRHPSRPMSSATPARSAPRSWRSRATPTTTPATSSAGRAWRRPTRSTCRAPRASGGSGSTAAARSWRT